MVKFLKIKNNNQARFFNLGIVELISNESVTEVVHHFFFLTKVILGEKHTNRKLCSKDIK